MNRGMITAYLRFLISGFDHIGSPLRPALIQLKIARLNASYVADTIHLFGEFSNIGI